MKFLLFACFLVAKSAASAIENHRATHEDLGPASYFNESTSPFVKIIKTEDVSARDAIYVNPAVLFVGKRTGEILRCLQAEPNECETFYQGYSMVYALLVTAEYLFAGLQSGRILRCDLYNKELCNTFYTGSSEIISLSADGGYLYASLAQPATILRCDLNQPNSCRSFLTMEKSYMWAFSHFDKYIYAGQNDGAIVRCSVRASAVCTVIYNMSSPIYGMANMADSVYAVTANGKLWNCLRKTDATIDCRPVSLNIGTPYYIASFNGELYVANQKGNICNWSNLNGTTCSPYVYHANAFSLAIAYETHQMQSRYKNEHATCGWQSNYNCPPFVTYYGPQDRAMLEVHVRNGKLYNSYGLLVDTRKAGNSGAAIFTMGPDGKILLSNVHLRELIHTSSLLAGNPVAGAGEMVVVNGVITSMTTCSEHYRPDLNLNRQVIQSLRTQGYTDQINSQTCSVNNEYEQI